MLSECGCCVLMFCLFYTWHTHTHKQTILTPRKTGKQKKTKTQSHWARGRRGKNTARATKVCAVCVYVYVCVCMCVHVCVCLYVCVCVRYKWEKSNDQTTKMGLLCVYVCVELWWYETVACIYFNYNTALHCTTLHYTTPHYTTLHCTTLYHTTLHGTTLHHNTTLYFTGPAFNFLFEGNKDDHFRMGTECVVYSVCSAVCEVCVFVYTCALIHTHTYTQASHSPSTQWSCLQISTDQVAMCVWVSVCVCVCVCVCNNVPLIHIIYTHIYVPHATLHHTTHCTTPLHTTMHCTTPLYTALHDITSHYTSLHYTTLHYTTLPHRHHRGLPCRSSQPDRHNQGHTRHQSIRLPVFNRGWVWCSVV
jgi:hypothetical protein